MKSKCDGLGKVKGYLMVGKRQMKDVQLIMKGQHPKYSDITHFIEKVNTDKRYKNKITYVAHPSSDVTNIFS